MGIFVGLAAQDNIESWDALERFGYLPANTVWSGHYWSLISSAFVHLAFWHLAFNVYWLWQLGSRMERSIGSLPFLAFYLASAFVSSAFELGLSSTTGIGASGAVYAIFGFMWLTRKQYPVFAETMTPRTIVVFIVWLFVCVATTVTKIWEVGNVAHFSGLIFGICVASAFWLRPYRAWGSSILAVMVVGSILFCYWCPWSITWLSTYAYDAHVAGRYQDAIDSYTRIIQLAPQNAWAYQNRSAAYSGLGDEEKAHADWEMACKLDPSIAKD